MRLTCLFMILGKTGFLFIFMSCQLISPSSICGLLELFIIDDSILSWVSFCKLSFVT